MGSSIYFIAELTWSLNMMSYKENLLPFGFKFTDRFSVDTSSRHADCFSRPASYSDVSNS